MHVLPIEEKRVEYVKKSGIKDGITGCIYLHPVFCEAAFVSLQIPEG